MRLNVSLIFSSRKMGQRLGNKKTTFLPVFVVLLACSSSGNRKKARQSFFRVKTKDWLKFFSHAALFWPGWAKL
jgi:hypothetical protein